MYGKVEVTVKGELSTFDLDNDFYITDISADMTKLSALMGFLSNIWGHAVEEQENVDAEYRAWRATFGGIITRADPKIAEWKLKQELEAHPSFLEHKRKIARTLRNVTALKGLFEALDKKGNQLQSKGAMMRSELDATGMQTRETPQPQRVSDDSRAQEAKAAMRATFKNKANKQKA